ncbi:MAG: MoxR family ATPase [Myxococcota bacterium]
MRTPTGGGVSCSRRGRSSRRSASPTRSTAPRRRPSPLCSRPCRRRASPFQASVCSSTPPFFVLATQNPVEMEGTYPLPEAQLDRFLFKLDVPFPSREVLREIGLRTTGTEDLRVDTVMNKAKLLELQDLVRRVLVAPKIADMAAHMVLATHPDKGDAPRVVRQYAQWGASPRAMQALLLAGRAEALAAGRAWVNGEDLARVAPHILRHRIILNFDARLEHVSSDTLVDAILAEV